MDNNLKNRLSEIKKRCKNKIKWKIIKNWIDIFFDLQKIELSSIRIDSVSKQISCLLDILDMNLNITNNLLIEMKRKSNYFKKEEILIFKNKLEKLQQFLIWLFFIYKEYITVKYACSNHKQTSYYDRKWNYWEKYPEWALFIELKVNWILDKIKKYEKFYDIKKMSKYKKMLYELFEWYYMPEWHIKNVWGKKYITTKKIISWIRINIPFNLKDFIKSKDNIVIEIKNITLKDNMWQFLYNFFELDNNANNNIIKIIKKPIIAWEKKDKVYQ